MSTHTQGYNYRQVTGLMAEGGSWSLHTHCNSHPSSDAKRSHTPSPTHLGEGVQQGDQDADSTGSDRVAQGNGASSEVDLGGNRDCKFYNHSKYCLTSYSCDYASKTKIAQISMLG